jgi:hypothetical protein
MNKENSKEGFKHERKMPKRESEIKMATTGYEDVTQKEGR